MAQPLPVVAAPPGANRWPGVRPWRRLLAPVLLAAAWLSLAPPLSAGVLDSVRRPDSPLAKSLCQRFRQLNAANRSALAPESIAEVEASQNLTRVDAEVLTTYVIEMHCKDVR